MKTLNMLRYTVAVHGIFVERLLNRKWSLNNDNIAVETEIMKKCLLFFEHWKCEIDEMVKKKTISRNEAEKLFIAGKTYNNLLVCVRGFFGYSSYILQKYNSVSFVRSVHSNQSSIEGFFFADQTYA